MKWRGDPGGQEGRRGGEPSTIRALLPPGHAWGFFFNNYFIFNWRIIALQCCVDFCHATTWISHESEVKVTQLCLKLCDPVGYRVYGILQARILEWVACPSSRGSSQPRDWTQVSHIEGGFFYQLSHQGSLRILEWVNYPFSCRSSWPRNRTTVSCIADGFFTSQATKINMNKVIRWHKNGLYLFSILIVIKFSRYSKLVLIWYNLILLLIHLFHISVIFWYLLVST